VLRLSMERYLEDRFRGRRGSVLGDCGARLTAMETEKKPPAAFGDERQQRRVKRGTGAYAMGHHGQHHRLNHPIRKRLGVTRFCAKVCQRYEKQFSRARGNWQAAELCLQSASCLAPPSRRMMQIFY
jgi:hypothetical protein